MDRDAPYTWWLLVAFAAVVLCFVGSTAYAQLVAREIGELSETLTTNAMPSIQHLASARADLRQLQVLADDYVVAEYPARAATLGAILGTEAKIDTDLDVYLRLPVYPGEDAFWQDIHDALSAVHAAVETTRKHIEAGDREGAAVSVKALDAACERAVAAVLAAIDFDAGMGEQMGRRIGEARRRSLFVALGLNTASVALSAVVALLVTRAVVAHARLLREHNELVARRAEELEQFAGRVAHDIRNPVSAAMLSLAALHRRVAGDEALRRLAARGVSSLERAARLLDGLLAFARAGARPAPDARADVGAVLRSVLDELGPEAAEKGVELRVEPLAGQVVRCEASILEVVLSNLIRNAIKYIGDGPERRVTVRARDAGPSSVRVEIEDTGAGIPEALRGSIFAPFVRGPTQGQQGVGLGLATVQRICDAHDGHAGVDAAPVRGSCFWFELPSAQAEPAARAV